MYAAMPQCQNIILGGIHDNGYAGILSRLESANISPGKVILLQGPTIAPELERFDAFLFPRLNFRELFMERKLDGGKKYARRGCHTNRRRVVLGDVVGVEARPFVCFDQLEPRLIEFFKR